MADVPQELIDLVVDDIHDDHRALINASFVCRSWSIATRPHLFRRAVFHTGFRSIPLSSDDKDDPPSFYRFQLLHEIIQGRPSIAYDIRDVVISGATDRKGSQWDKSQPFITPVLSCLRRVNSVTLRDVEWQCLSLECKQSLLSIFSSPSLEHVDLHTFNTALPIVFTLLGLAKNLQSVRSAYTPTGMTYGSGYFEQPTERVALHSLELGAGVEQFAIHLLDPECPVVLSDLHHLRMTAVTDIPTCGQLLRAAGKSLEILELWAPTSREPRRVGDDISLNWMPALRSFQIKGLLFSPAVCSVPCLCDIFSVESTHDIEKIDFLVDADNSRRAVLDWGTWAQLDILLASPLFRSLTSVDIRLHFSRPNSHTFLNTAALRRSMPRLLRREILSVECVG